MAQITEVLMGLGSFDFGLKREFGLVDQLPLYDHVLVYDGEDRIYCGVILTRDPKARTISGRGIDWWLGLESDGPIIEDREYISGNSKLSNGNFVDDDLLWRVDEDPLWVISTGLAEIVGTPDRHERLESNESFECEPGQQLRATAEIERVTGDTGRLILRLVFSGRFRWPNLVSGVTWLDVSATAGDATVGVDEFTLGPVTARQSIQNSNFEDDLDHWYDPDGAYDVVTSLDIGIFQGTKSLRLAAFGSGGHQLTYDDDAASTPPLEKFDVVPGERFFMQAAITPWAAAGASTHADGFVWFSVMFLDASGLNPVFFSTPDLTVDDVPNPGWVLVSVENTVPDGCITAQPYFYGANVTTGAWGIDALSFTHLEKNTAEIEGDAFAVTAERSYKLLAAVTSDPGVEGDFKARVVFHGDGRDDITVESSTLGATEGVEKLFSFDFTPPSGYTAASVVFVGVDVKRGSFRVRRSSLSVQDTDESTKPVDVRSDETTTGSTELTLDTAVPDGAERFHLEVIAEDLGDGWQCTATNVHRTETPAAGEDVVDDLLRDPDTGDYLVPPGTIHPAGTIVHDWRIRNLANRDALKQLAAAGLLADAHEWKLNPDPSLDFGTPAEIFVDRDDFVLVEDADLILRDKPDAVADVTSRVTRVKLLGADRTPVAGQKQLITGVAEADPDGATDWFGNPLRRTRIVEDSTVDTQAYADGRSQLELAKTSTPASSTRLGLADYRTAGRFDVGDTIHVYAPTAELVDEANELEWKGKTVWPIAKRVIARTRKLGPGHRVEIRASDGTTRDITEFVSWEAETSAEVTLGDNRPEFVVDPQGGAAGLQFRRYRGSTGR